MAKERIHHPGGPFMNQSPFRGKRRSALGAMALIALLVTSGCVAVYTNVYSSPRASGNYTKVKLLSGASAFQDLFVTRIREDYPAFTFVNAEQDVELNLFGDITFNRPCVISLFGLDFMCEDRVRLQGFVYAEIFDAKTGEQLFSLVKHYVTNSAGQPWGDDEVVDDLMQEIAKGLKMKVAKKGGGA
jgi:hypothetical protein